MKARLVQGCLFALLILSLVGCNATEPGREANAPNVLHVVRNGLPSYHIAPLDIVIHDAKQVQDLYKAIYALKKIPSDAVFSCPLDIGLVYHLEFLRADTSFQQMDLNTTGCRFLSFNTPWIDFLHLSDPGGRITTPAFLAQLAGILHLSSLNPTSYV